MKFAGSPFTEDSLIVPGFMCVVLEVIACDENFARAWYMRIVIPYGPSDDFEIKRLLPAPSSISDVNLSLLSSLQALKHL